jgi:hypothetical protein
MALPATRARRFSERDRWRSMIRLARPARDRNGISAIFWFADDVHPPKLRFVSGLEASFA